MKRIIGMVLVACFALTLTGCGSDSKTSGKPGAPPPAPPPGPPTPAVGPAKVGASNAKPID